MYCEKCGKKLEGSEIFCSNCGEKISKKNEEKNTKQLNDKMSNDAKAEKKKVTIFVLLFLLLLCAGYLCTKYKIKDLIYDIGVSQNANMTLRLSDNTTKGVHIEETEIKEKVNNLMSSINTHYSKANINQVNEIKAIYNYKEKTIEYIYLSVNLDRYCVVDNGRAKVASVCAAMDRTGRYIDNIKATENGKTSDIFNIKNISSSCGLLTQEDNSILKNIKDNLNKGRDNTFYWEKKVY